MDYKYKGNNDFRGWLAGNSDLSYVNNYVGNDGKINRAKVSQDAKYAPTKVYGQSADQFQSYVSSLYNQFNQAKGYSDQYQSLLSAIDANRTPTPRFVNFDTAGSWNKARQMATKAVSPIYQQKMSDFINRQQQELGRQKADTVTQKSALDTALDRLLGDNALNRTRTEEDTTTNINDINANQAYNARTEGLNFDVASRSLNEGLSEAGVATSGLGQGIVQENQLARNAMSNEQVRQSENKVEAAKTLMSRTFADLETSDTRGKEDTAGRKQQLNLDLERYIEDQAYERDQTRKQLALEKEADIAQKSIGLQGQLVDQFIQSLSGQGYTAQEIANAASMYR